MAHLPGPGDPETWGPYAGHPNDPRAPEEDEEQIARDELLYELQRVQARLDKAERMLEMDGGCDERYEAAFDIIRAAAADLLRATE